jgi:creatinine amidohydrolase
MSLATETYYRAIADLCESLLAGGFRRLFIVNGHGGNDELVQLVARDLALKHAAHLAAASYWTIAWDALIAAEAHAQGGLPGHAGAFETSLVMALQPGLVREPRPHRADATGADPRGPRRAYRAESHGAWQSFDGYTDSPDRGTAERGHAYLAAIAGAVGRAFVEFHTATGGQRLAGDES